MDTAINAVPSRKPNFFVLQSGLITTALALAGVYWLNKNSEDFQIMGWYAKYIIPIGAMLVGFVAGSGYGLASWFTGVRISRWLLVAVLAAQTVAYVAAEYVDYRDVRQSFEERGLVMEATGQPPTFIEYYDFKARSFTWKSKYSKKENEPLGAWGYVFVLLGAAGFIGSGLIAPAILMAVPYCDGCQRYMTRKVMGCLPASPPVRKISKSDVAGKEAYAAELLAAGTYADHSIQRLRDTASAADADAFKAELVAAGDMNANNKLPRRFEIALVWCKLCNGGHILPTALSGKGDQVQRVKLEQTPVSPDFVRAMLGK